MDEKEFGVKYVKRTKKEKTLLCLIIISVAIIVALLIAIILVVKPSKQEEVCLTKTCIKAAARMMEAIDFKVDPCTDFHEFSCGNWKRLHIIPEDKSGYSSFSLLRDNVAIFLKGLLEDEQMLTNIKSIEKARTLYRSCMNETSIEISNYTAILELVTTMGSWPILSPEWNPESFDMEGLLVKVMQHSIRPLINLYVSTDVKDSERNIIYTDQTYFGMPGSKYLIKGRDDKMVKAYENYARQIAIELGADPLVAERDISDMLDFEIKLANIVTPQEERRDNEALYNKMTVSELQRDFSEVNWTRVLGDLFKAPGIHIHLTPDEPIVARDPAYLEKLMPLLRTTNKRTKQNYIVWRLVKSLANGLTAKIRELGVRYKKVLYGTKAEKPRWDTCVSYATGSLRQAVGRLFIEKHFDENSRTAVLDMIAGLRHAMIELVKDLDWMDDDTKPIAIDKANAMHNNIGFPQNPNILNHTVLDNLYQNLTYDEDTYFENILQNRKWANVEQAKVLREKTDRTEWHAAPSTVNAFYSPTRNAIMFPAGILQPPFYHKDQPMSMNFGGIGMVIGHEITHGFDDRGRQYDKGGNLLQWWNDESISKFEERAQCVVKKYGSYRMEDVNMNVNGINTQGENIADLGGIKQSFRAYRNWVRKRGYEEAVLPGLNFTSNQLFFINFAQVWCSNSRPEQVVKYILTGAHSPMRYRVIGSLQNSEQFSEVFHCAKGTYMNPDKKCSVW